MAVIDLHISNEMKEEFLNDWKNGNIYLIVNYNQSIIGSKKIVFDDATSATGGRKIVWTPSGTTGANGSDFEIPVGTTVSNITLTDNGTDLEQHNIYATVGINETFTYGGIVRIDKVTITLT